MNDFYALFFFRWGINEEDKHVFSTEYWMFIFELLGWLNTIWKYYDTKIILFFVNDLIGKIAGILAKSLFWKVLLGICFNQIIIMLISIYMDGMCFGSDSAQFNADEHLSIKINT